MGEKIEKLKGCCETGIGTFTINQNVNTFGFRCVES